MSDLDALRQTLDALPRPVRLVGCLQLISESAEHSQGMLRREYQGDPWYTATDLDEMRFLLEYMEEENNR